MHIRLILNGKGVLDETLREAVELLRGEGLRLDVRVTWEDGDAERYVDEAVADGVDALVAAGGDGTLNAVCSRLAASGTPAASLPSVGVLPMGTANDFATAAGLPEDAEHALRLVAADRACPIDLLRLRAGSGEERWCVNLATGGFGTAVTTETDPGLKKVLGRAAYFLTGLTRFASIASASGVMRGEGFSWEGDFLVLGLGNGRQAGGGHVLCPEAVLDDGLLELAVLPDVPEGERGAALGELLRQGRAAIEAAAITARLPWIELETAGGLCLNLDGEPFEARRFRIDVVPGRLRLHLPRDCPLLAASYRPATVDP